MKRLFDPPVGSWIGLDGVITSIYRTCRTYFEQYNTMLKECLLQSVECELLQQYSALVGYPSNIAHPVSYPSNIAVR
jgi:hypothetical protein